MICPGVASALSTVTGMLAVRGFSRSRRKTSSPEISGRCRSSRIQSGLCRSARSRPRYPCIAESSRTPRDDARKSAPPAADWTSCLRCRAPCRDDATRFGLDQALSADRPAPGWSAGPRAWSAPQRTCCRNPRELSTPMVPPMASISRFDSASPSPVPPASVLSAPRRSNGVKIFFRPSGEIPEPVSRTSIRSLLLVRLLARQHHGAAAAVELDGVRQQIQQHLFQPLPVRLHMMVAAERDIRTDADMLLDRQRPHQVERVLQRFPHPNRL